MLVEGAGTRQAHTDGDWIVVSEPTETESGERQKVCSICGAVTAKEQLLPTGSQKAVSDNNIKLYIGIGIACAALLIAGVVCVVNIIKKRQKKQ